MHDDSCIGINYAHRFPKCFRSLHTLLGFSRCTFVLLNFWFQFRFLEMTDVHSWREMHGLPSFLASAITSFFVSDSCQLPCQHHRVFPILCPLLFLALQCGLHDLSLKSFFQTLAHWFVGFNDAFVFLPWEHQECDEFRRTLFPIIWQSIAAGIGTSNFSPPTLDSFFELRIFWINEANTAQSSSDVKLRRCLSISLATSNQTWMSFVPSSTATWTTKIHLDVFRPIWWIVWTQSTNGFLRYSNHRPCGVQAWHPRSCLLFWSRQCIVVKLGMILLSACEVWLSVQRDDGTCSSQTWTRNHFLHHHHPAMTLEVVVKTTVILQKDFLALLLGPGCPERIFFLGGPVSRWMFSGPDLLQGFGFVHLRLEK